MEVSANGIELVKRFEGLYLKDYICPGGVRTIGYGHTGADVYPGRRISEQEADLILLKDLYESKKKVDKYQSVYSFNQNEYDALVSFAFNIGNIDQLTAKGTRSKSEIAEKMMLYCKASGKVLAGLEKRRKAERELFLSPVAGSASKKKTQEQIAQEVIQGLWGNGKERERRLTEAGYDYKKIQSKVNKLLK